jgi:hypothetical protein
MEGEWMGSAYLSMLDVRERLAEFLLFGQLVA